MSVFSDEERQKIADAIQAAEETTSGEIVVVVAKESDNYRYIALLWASLIALALPLALIYLPKLTGWRLAFQGPEILYLIQLVWFLVLAVLLQLPLFRYALVPKSLRARRTRRAATEQFLARNLHASPNRTGVLIYVSLAERQAEIIADDLIAQKVDKTIWQEMVDALTRDIAASRAAEGFVSAIEASGKLLSAHFPSRSPHEVSEHPNHLIELG